MNRREIILGASAVVAATALPSLAPAIEPFVQFSSAELVPRMWTYVSIAQSMGESSPYPFHMTGYVMHKPDLSDLGEPYLSAVREAISQRGPLMEASEIYSDYQTLEHSENGRG